MTRRSQAILLVVVAGLAMALWWWYSSAPQERAIKRRLEQFAEEFNSSTRQGEGLASLAHAARLGQFFTPDIVVELGQGTQPIQGRETLMGMAARLQPRTAGFVLELDDVTVESMDQTRADVILTALIRRRSFGSGEESLDAREFAVEMRNDHGTWRMARVVAVDTLR
jgi:SnoaL-like domain